MKKQRTLKTCLMLALLGLILFAAGKMCLVAKAEEQSGVYHISQAGAVVDAELSYDTPDDSWFMSGEKEFNPSVARLSAILSMLCYKEYSGNPSVFTLGGRQMDAIAFMEHLGFSDVRDVELPKADFLIFPPSKNKLFKNFPVIFNFVVFRV